MIYQGEVLEAEYVQFPGDVKIVDLTMAAFCTLAVAENGDVYYWGKYQVRQNKLSYNACIDRLHMLAS